MKERCASLWKNLTLDLYERIIRNWRSTFTALLILVGLWQWHVKNINTEELIAFLGVIGTTVGIFYKRDEG